MKDGTRSSPIAFLFARADDAGEDATLDAELNRRLERAAAVRTHAVAASIFREVNHG